MFFAGDHWGFGQDVGFYGQHTLAAVVLVNPRRAVDDSWRLISMAGPLFDTGLLALPFHATSEGR